MNNLKSFIIFISMVLLIYGSTNTYIYKRVVYSAHLTGGWVTLLRLTLFFMILAYPISRFTFPLRSISTPLTWIGGFWLAAMCYALIGFAVVDFLRLTDLAIGWFPNWLTGNGFKISRILLISGTVTVAILLVIGRIIAANPVVRKIELTLDRLPPNKDGYRVVLFSDVHLGTIIGEKFLNRLVDQVNDLNPNLILIPGDLVDEPPRYLPWALEPLRRLKSSNGVIVTMGNHEYYAGAGESIKFFRDAGFTFLRDQAIEIPGTAIVAGMDDVTGSRQFGERPIPIRDYTSQANQYLPLIVLHHTPVRIQEVRDAKADLLVSGHAHGGQQWPFGYITRMIFKVKNGLTKFDKLNFYLTTGAGTWGPPIRLGATPEVVLFTLHSRH